MSLDVPTVQLTIDNANTATLTLSGEWSLRHTCPRLADFAGQLHDTSLQYLQCKGDNLGRWDSALPSFLLQCHEFCQARGMQLNVDVLPEGARKLLAVATAVEPRGKPVSTTAGPFKRFDFSLRLKSGLNRLATSLEFIGAITLALGRLLIGRSKTRRVDFFDFVYQAGPDAFGIITLTSFLVGMILAYLGVAQLLQFGAQLYVADLVTIGMLREMGALMTAVVMAGRTGAAYAAQLGTMQTNEEIDAITTLGISPVEFLVLPRMLALVLIMPLLCLYANIMGILGGALVAAGMGVSLTQFMVQMQAAITPEHLGIGLFKSIVFGVLIAIAGCRAGIQCGRSSAAVGQAATNAVVTSIVYLIVADAAINIVAQALEI